MSIPNPAHRVEVGQWVTFDHKFEKLPQELRGPFYVLKGPIRDCNGFHYGLLNTKGHLHDYIPTAKMLGVWDLPRGFTVRAITDTETLDELDKKIKDAKKRVLNPLRSLTNLQR